MGVRPMSTGLKRVIARTSLAIGLFCLAMQAIGVRMVHHSLPVMILGMVPPVLAVLGSLNYLRMTRGQR